MTSAPGGLAIRDAGTVIPPLGDTLGVVLAAVLICSALFGILCSQVHYYYKRFPRDSTWMKFMVGIVLIIELVHSLICSMIPYNYLIQHYGDASFLSVNSKSIAITVILEPFPPIITQLFFARRLQILRPQLWPVTVLTVFIALFSFTLGTLIGVKGYESTEVSQRLAYQWEATCWLMLGAVGDLLVAVPVACTLYKARTGVNQTDRLLNKLIIWMITTGLVTLVLQVAAVVAFLVAPSSLYNFALELCIPKVFSNSLLAFLNRRSTYSIYGDSDHNIHNMSSSWVPDGTTSYDFTLQPVRSTHGLDVSLPGVILPLENISISVTRVLHSVEE